MMSQLQKKTLESIEGAIKNGHSRKPGTLGTQDEEKQNKQEKHFTEQVKDITKIYLVDEKCEKGLDLIMI